MNENKLKSLNIKVMNKTVEVFKFLCNNKQPDIVIPPSHFFLIENPFFNDPEYPIFAIILAPEIISNRPYKYPQSMFFFNKPSDRGIIEFKFLINHQNLDVDLNDLFSRIIAFYLNSKVEKSNFNLFGLIRARNHMEFRYKMVYCKKIYLYFNPLAFVNDHFIPINKASYNEQELIMTYTVKDGGKEYIFPVSLYSSPVY